MNKPTVIERLRSLCAKWRHPLKHFVPTAKEVSDTYIANIHVISENWPDNTLFADADPAFRRLGLLQFSGAANLSEKGFRKAVNLIRRRGFHDPTDVDLHITISVYDILTIASQEGFRFGRQIDYLDWLFAITAHLSLPSAQLQMHKRAVAELEESMKSPELKAAESETRRKEWAALREARSRHGPSEPLMSPEQIQPYIGSAEEEATRRKSVE